MCGIFGYIGAKNPLHICLSGLEQLEYRGYDSAGIAGIVEGQIESYKKAGKLSNLKQHLPMREMQLAIAHTRWATHGKVSDLNAHPHLDFTNSIALIHNGIIENYLTLRDHLTTEGIHFQSETDTEVIVQLISWLYRGDLVDAVQKALPLLKGIYAIALIHKQHPDQIIAAARECPLAIGIDEQNQESFFSSDPNTFISSRLEVLFLQNGEMAKIEKGKVSVYNAESKLICKQTEPFEVQYSAPSKEGFDHFLRKEIHEQPTTVQSAIFGRFCEKTANVQFESMGFTENELRQFKRVWILGCGSSAHAGSIAASYLEEIARIPAFCEIASEARYREPVLTPDTLVIGISQSGETADTIAAMRLAKSYGCKTLAICNVKHSTMMRESDGVIDLKAGVEISVCSTKALTSQIATLALFALHLARLNGRDPHFALQFFSALKQIPEEIQRIIDQAPALCALASKYAHFNDFFFMGRRYMYTTCLEAALKLKEISYLNANGYPAGELKHGAIALIDPRFPVIAFCANKKTKDKMLSNLAEVKARGAPILAFAPEGMENIASIADDVFWLPPTSDLFAPFTSTVAGQLFAYFIATQLGCDVDRPRHLAKSVTVE